MSTSPNPRWFLRRPNRTAVDDFLAALANASFTYEPRGASRDGSPAGFTLDDTAVQIGQGAADFERAGAAVRAWAMFPVPWTFITPPDAPIAVGTTIAMCAYGCGTWWLNACRIVYVVDETGADGSRRFGFAYGTLTAHVEMGEELFLVEQRADGSVWYRIRAFSRPRYWPVKLMKPLARRLQKRFVRESLRTMQTRVQGSAV